MEKSKSIDHHHRHSLAVSSSPRRLWSASGAAEMMPNVQNWCIMTYWFIGKCVFEMRIDRGRMEFNFHEESEWHSTFLEFLSSIYRFMFHANGVKINSFGYYNDYFASFCRLHTEVAQHESPIRSLRPSWLPTELEYTWSVLPPSQCTRNMQNSVLRILCWIVTRNGWQQAACCVRSIVGLVV